MTFDLDSLLLSWNKWSRGLSCRKIVFSFCFRTAVGFFFNVFSPFVESAALSLQVKKSSPNSSSCHCWKFFLNLRMFLHTVPRRATFELSWIASSDVLLLQNWCCFMKEWHRRLPNSQGHTSVAFLVLNTVSVSGFWPERYYKIDDLLQSVNQSFFYTPCIQVCNWSQDQSLNCWLEAETICSVTASRLVVVGYHRHHIDLQQS